MNLHCEPIGRRLHRVRTEAKRDTRWLAEQLHATLGLAATVDFVEELLVQIEGGAQDVQIHVQELAAIAKALDCSLLYLLGVEGEPTRVRR